VSRQCRNVRSLPLVDAELSATLRASFHQACSLLIDVCCSSYLCEAWYNNDMMKLYKDTKITQERNETYLLNSIPPYASVLSSWCTSSLTRVRQVSHTCDRYLAHVCEKLRIRTKREFCSYVQTHLSWWKDWKI
jgi:hypothetical protein